MSPRAEKALLAVALAVAVAAVCLTMFWFFVRPLYRDGHRRSMAAQAMMVAAALRPAVAERLLRRDGRPIGEGIRIPARPPVTGGYIAADGSVVVYADLDLDHALTIVLSPKIAPHEVQWTCGVAQEAQLRYVPSSCHSVVRIP